VSNDVLVNVDALTWPAAIVAVALVLAFAHGFHEDRSNRAALRLTVVRECAHAESPVACGANIKQAIRAAPVTAGATQAAVPGSRLPPKEPGRHRWIVVASYTLTDEEVGATTVVLDQAHLFSPPEVGCVDCERRYADCRTDPCEADDEWTEPMAASADLRGALPVEAEEALLAGVDLVGRTGATGFTVGHVNEPHEKPDWYAAAEYRGARIIVEHHPGPVSATEALARRLLRDGECTHCHRVIKLGGSGGKACRWWRDGRTWRRGCER
jgi:hypothetical protein